MLSQVEYDRADKALSKVIACPGAFTEFQVDFAMTNADRLDKHRLNTRLTNRQWRVIERIEITVNVLEGDA